ncbi:MAG: glutamate--tRNA ligase [Candidatus Taylorbacteria bacterium]|nr:glutamate--tRNA ligase [Candidatus Taylorbacteria bacterium]
MKIITRFAPSPTGKLHIGSARTALFNYLFTRHAGGTYLLRIEDTDKERSTAESEKNILDGLKWFGIDFDNPEKIMRQSERTSIYKKHIEKLIADGHAFISKETPVKEGGREEVIRFKNPNKKISFDDMIRGTIEFDTTELGDFVIAKSLEEPIFHLTNVVDDIEMGITHIIRGEDHISNTPRQILIWEAIGAPRAIYAHIPLILATDRSKLSKRHGAVSIVEYAEKGYLPEALMNYLAMLGWNPGIDKEVFSKEELVELFDITKVQKGGAIFNEEKLKWINKEHIKMAPRAEIIERIKAYFPPGKELPKNSELFFADLVERISIFSDVKELVGKGELNYFFEAPTYDAKSLVWKKDTPENSKVHLLAVLAKLENISESASIPETANDFSVESVKNAIWPYAEEKGKGNVLWPLRFALSGQDKSPDPFTLASILGKEESLLRIKNAISLL